MGLNAMRDASLCLLPDLGADIGGLLSSLGAALGRVVGLNTIKDAAWASLPELGADLGGLLSDLGAALGAVVGLSNKRDAVPGDGGDFAAAIGADLAVNKPVGADFASVLGASLAFVAAISSIRVFDDQCLEVFCCKRQLSFDDGTLSAAAATEQKRNPTA